MVPEPLFTVFGQPVTLYGICIAVGILICLLVFYKYTKFRKMDSSIQDFCFYVAIIAIAIGFLFAKLYQTVYNWIETGKFDFEHAGITAMGGFIGGAAAFILCYFVGGNLIFKGEKKGLHIKEFNTILLVAPLSILIAHAFGRIGCLMAGCCHGAYLGQEYVFGGIWMKGTIATVNNGWGYYVPTQLYESLFLFVTFGLLSLAYFKGCNITMQIYLFSYGLWRIIIEVFRADPRGAIILGLAPSQWQSIIFMAGGIAMLLFYIFKKIPLWIDMKTYKSPFELLKEQILNTTTQDKAE